MHLGGLPRHDLQQGLGQLQAALDLARLPGREVQLALLELLLVGGAVAVLLVLGIRERGLDLAEHRERRRQAPVGQQRPHVLVALDLGVVAVAVHGAKALELVEHQDARRALDDARLGQHGRDRAAAVVAGAVAEAVHLHFDEAVVEAQVLGELAHQLRLAGAGQAPEADDDRAADELRQHIPGAQRFDHAIDDVVDAEEFFLQRSGDGLQVLRALGELGMQFGMDVGGHGMISLNETGTKKRPPPRKEGAAGRRCEGTVAALLCLKRATRKSGAGLRPGGAT
jgi:hypothetical protein